MAARACSRSCALIPARLGLESLLCEIARLQRVRAIGLPADLFSEADEKRVALWRSRAAAEHPSWLRAHPREVRLTLLACFCWSRTTEITDSLVDLLLGVVHKMGARADDRVEQELVADLKAVRGKRGILFALAGAAVERPDDTVRRAIFPVVGEQTLRELVREAQANDQAFRAQVRKVLRSSYSNHYRRMLPAVLEALQFRCNNTAHRPLMDALELLRRYAHRERVVFYDPADRVPLDGVVRPDVAGGGRRRARPGGADPVRAVRAHQPARRDPPPRDLGARLASLARPGDRPAPGLRGAPRDALRRDQPAARPDRVHRPAPRRPRPGARPPVRRAAPRHRRRGADHDPQGRACGSACRGWASSPSRRRWPAIKREIIRRWGVVDLLDVLKEADYLTGFTDELTTIATREIIPRERVRRRLLLTLFALGTNMGIAKIAAAGEHGESEHTLRRTRQTHINRDNLRRAIIRVVNATLAARDQRWWGNATTRRERLQAVRLLGLEPDDRVPRPLRRPRRDDLLARRAQQRLHPQPAHHLLSKRSRRDARKGCCTTAPTPTIEANYTDTHGASVVGFAFCHLLGFRLLPRLKKIGKATLYRPDDGASYPGSSGS